MPGKDGDQQFVPLLRFDRIAAVVLAGALMSTQARSLLGQAGLRWAHLLLLAFSLGYVGTPIAYRVAHRIGALDVPAGRKSHKAPTALLGGAVIYSAFVLTILRNFAFSVELKGVVLASSLILAIGLIDDLRELPARWKVLGQLVAVGILIRYDVVISFLPDTVWGQGGEWLITAIWVVGITNAVNFLDGMDGLAAGTSGIAAVFLGLVALQNGQYYMLYLAMPLVGAALSFLVYNFRPGRPALIFLGDAGSTFLGFVVASLGVMGDWAGDHLVRLIVPVLILGVPIFDMTFTTVTRVRSGAVRSVGQWLEYTGRDHIHHRLEAIRTGRVGAVLIIYTICVWLGLSALALKNTTGVNALLQVAQSVIVFLLLSFFMLFVSRKYSEIETMATIAGLDPDGNDVSLYE